MKKRILNSILSFCLVLLVSFGLVACGRPVLTELSIEVTTGETIYASDKAEQIKTKIVVTATYNNGTTDKITDYNVNIATDKTSFTVSVGEGNDEVTSDPFTMTAVKLTNLTIALKDANTLVYVGDTDDQIKTKIVVTATYNNGTTDKITDYNVNIATDGTSFTVSVGEENDKVTSDPFTITPVKLKEVTIAFINENTFVYVGDTDDQIKTKITISGTNNDGSTATITDYVIVKDNDNNTFTIKVDNIVSNSLKIYAIEELTLTQNFPKQAFVGEEFDVSLTIENTGTTDYNRPIYWNTRTGNEKKTLTFSDIAVANQPNVYVKEAVQKKGSDDVSYVEFTDEDKFIGYHIFNVAIKAGETITITAKACATELSSNEDYVYGTMALTDNCNSYSGGVKVVENLTFTETFPKNVAVGEDFDLKIEIKNNYTAEYNGMILINTMDTNEDLTLVFKDFDIKSSVENRVFEEGEFDLQFAVGRNGERIYLTDLTEFTSDDKFIGLHIFNAKINGGETITLIAKGNASQVREYRLKVLSDNLEPGSKYINASLYADMTLTSVDIALGEGQTQTLSNSSKTTLTRNGNDFVVGGEIDHISAEMKQALYPENDVTHVVVLLIKFDPTKTVKKVTSGGTETKVWSNEEGDKPLSQIYNPEGENGNNWDRIIAANTSDTYNTAIEYTDGTICIFTLKIEATLNELA